MGGGESRHGRDTDAEMQGHRAMVEPGVRVGAGASSGVALTEFESEVVEHGRGGRIDRPQSRSGDGGSELPGARDEHFVCAQEGDEAFGVFREFEAALIHLAHGQNRKRTDLSCLLHRAAGRLAVAG